MKKGQKRLLALVLLMGIGFASVVATLYINGTATIANADFDVIFTKASLDGTDISETAISNGGTEITYTTSDLNSVGDQSVLNFTVKNNSPMYDGVVSIDCTVDGENSEYYTVSELIDGEETTTIESMHAKDGTITVALSKVSTENISEQFTCTINASAEERTTVGEAQSPIVANLWRPNYFAYAESIDSITSTELPEGHNVFLAMDAEGNAGICVVKNGTRYCFEEKSKTSIQKMQTAFSDWTCEYSDAVDESLKCETDEFKCEIYDYNENYDDISCTDKIKNEYCAVEYGEHRVCVNIYP